MNYERIYNQIVSQAKASNRSKLGGTYECHHIIPHCAGGTNEKTNLVLLTPREHFICHLLLVKFSQEQHKRSLMFAVGMMRSRGLVVSGRLYEMARSIHSEAVRASRLGKTHSEETKTKIASSNLGQKRTEEQKQRIREAQRGKVLSAEHRAKLSKATKGVSKPMSDEHKAALRGKRGPWTDAQHKARELCAERIRLAHVGRKRTDETKAKISAARKASLQS